MQQKVIPLSDHDLAEVEKFRQYLGDLHGDMPRKEFVRKWGEYLGLNTLAQEALYAKALAEDKAI